MGSSESEPMLPSSIGVLSWHNFFLFSTSSGSLLTFTDTASSIFKDLGRVEYISLMFTLLKIGFTNEISPLPEVECLQTNLVLLLLLASSTLVSLTAPVWFLATILETLDGMGRSDRDFMAESSAGVLDSTIAFLARRTSSSSSTFTFVTSLVSRKLRGNVEYIVNGSIDVGSMSLCLNIHLVSVRLKEQLIKLYNSLPSVLLSLKDHI